MWIDILSLILIPAFLLLLTILTVAKNASEVRKNWRDLDPLLRKKFEEEMFKEQRYAAAKARGFELMNMGSG